MKPGASDSAARAAELRRRLTDAEHAYYVLDQPQMDDAEYDALLRELQVLESADPELVRPDSPTQRVGGSPSGAFAPVPHRVVQQVGHRLQQHLHGLLLRHRVQP